MFDEWRARQHGVVTRWQALAGGLGRTAIETRLATGRWRRLAGGVYATRSGPLTRPAELWAAVLGSGEGAVLSHHSAAELVGLAAGGVGPIHVTVPARRHPEPLPGVVVHRSRRVGWARHPHRSPPQTRVEETVLDLWESAAGLDEALDWPARACGRRLTTPQQMLLAFQARGRLRWRSEFLEALDDVAAGCRSALDLRYLRDVERAHGLPVGERRRARHGPGRRLPGGVYYRGFGTLVQLDQEPAPAFGGLQAGALRFGRADVLERPCVVADEIAVVLRDRGWHRHPRACSPRCLALTP